MRLEEIETLLRSGWKTTVDFLYHELIVLGLTVAFFFGKRITKGNGMLEGKEIVQKIGEYGEASLDITGDMKLKLAVAVEVDLIAELKKLAAKTSTPIDDQAIAWVESVVKAAALLPSAAPQVQA